MSRTGSPVVTALSVDRRAEGTPYARTGPRSSLPTGIEVRDPALGVMPTSASHPACTFSLEVRTWLSPIIEESDTVIPLSGRVTGTGSKPMTSPPLHPPTIVAQRDPLQIAA